LRLRRLEDVVILLVGVLKADGKTLEGTPSRGGKSGSRRLESVGVGNGATLGVVAGVKPSWHFSLNSQRGLATDEVCTWEIMALLRRW
jgi:hypothetical protein